MYIKLNKRRKLLELKLKAKRKEKENELIGEAKSEMTKIINNNSNILSNARKNEDLGLIFSHRKYDSYNMSHMLSRD